MKNNGSDKNRYSSRKVTKRIPGNKTRQVFTRPGETGDVSKIKTSGGSFRSNHKNGLKRNSFFDRLSARATKATGSTAAFFIALGLVLIWAITGPFFGFSETWQLVINTGTTIVTFLMVFMIQKSQNKDSLAVQLKLNELVASSQKASNRLVDVENLTEEELTVIHQYYHELSELSKNAKNLLQSHSIDEAHERHAEKHHKLRKRPNKSL